MPFATTWMDFEGIMLSEVRRDKYPMISLMCDLKKTNTKQKPNLKLIDMEKRLVVARGWGEAVMHEGSQKVKIKKKNLEYD